MKKKLTALASSVAAAIIFAGQAGAVDLLSSNRETGPGVPNTVPPRQALYKVDSTSGIFTKIGDFDPTGTILNPADIVEITVWNGQLWGTNHLQPHFYQIDAGTGQIMSTDIIATGQNFIGLGTHTDPLLGGPEEYIWGTETVTGEVYKIDPNTAAVESRGLTFPPGYNNPRITDIAGVPNDDFMYAVGNGNQMLWQVDLTNGAFTNVGTGWGLGPEARMDGVVWDDERETLVSQSRHPGDMIDMFPNGAIFDIALTDLIWDGNPVSPGQAYNPRPVDSNFVIGVGDLSTFVGIPEPTTVGLGLLGIALLALRRRRS